MGVVGAPETPDDYVRFETAGIIVFVHEEVLASADDTMMLRFHFGRFGWCKIELPSKKAKKRRTDQGSR